MITLPMTVLGPWGVPLAAPPPSETDTPRIEQSVGDVTLISVRDGFIMDTTYDEGHITQVELGDGRI